jgi:HEAT repeat protein
MRFEAAWLELPERTRVEAINALSGLAEASIERNFDRVLEIAIRRDPNPAVRQLAVAASSEREDQAYARMLLELVERDPSIDVRAAAAGGLALFCDLAVAGSADAYGALGDEIHERLSGIIGDREEHPLVRGKALESIAAFGSEPLIAGEIEGSLHADDESLRASSLIAMGRTCDRRWLGDLLQELRSEDVVLRRAAAIACGRMGEADAIVSLGTVARDDDPEVRRAAIWSIGTIGGSAAATTLRKLRDVADDKERSLIDAAMNEAELGDLSGGELW